MISSLNNFKLISCLKNGGVAVIPTDTLYGLVARAADKDAVERVYKIRGRDEQKPCVVLVADISQITDSPHWPHELNQIANKYWPGPLSLVTPTRNVPKYLHRGTNTIAYRVPGSPEMRKLLAATGPLIAPSANLQGSPPAANIDQAKKYFGSMVDFYVDGGERVNSQPSTVAAWQDGKIKILRQGAIDLHTLSD